jgi:hypothetical protein
MSAMRQPGEGGIKSGMKSDSRSLPNRKYPTWDDVDAALGDKFIEALIVAVRATREDLADYRRFRPSWVAQHSERGLAGWIHDRLWHHLTVGVADLPQVIITDEGVLREITVGPATEVMRFRIKRTHMDGDVSTYETQMALEFLAQADGMLEIFGELHLIAGYRWDRDERAIGHAVISLRDGRDNIKWEKDLEDTAGQSGSLDNMPAKPKPPAPVIDSGSVGLQSTPEEK